MEQDLTQGSEHLPKRAKSGAQRQAEYRAKNRSQSSADGQAVQSDDSTLQTTEIGPERNIPTKQDKFFTTGLGPPRNVLKTEKFSGLKMSSIGDASSASHPMPDRMNLHSKIQRLANQQLPDLNQLFLGAQSEKERSTLVEQTIRENIFLLLEYMEAYQSPSQDFLQIIIDIGSTLEESIFTKLLVRVCKMHRQEALPFTAGMAMQVMSFLCDTKQDNMAANGMLRLIFQNDISLTSFPIPMLVVFQATYERVIANHFGSIQDVDKAVLESLPASVYCITTPILLALKRKGHVLHHNIPFQFLPYVLEIAGLSFTENLSIFNSFFDTLQGGCRRFYENLLEYKFELLLEALCAETRVTTSIFFGSLQEQTRILTKAFELIAEKRLTRFDGPTNQMLIKGSQESFQAMRNRPKFLSASRQSLIHRSVKEFQLQNPSYTEDILWLATSLTAEQAQVFASLGVENLLVQQLIAFNHCVSKQSVGHYFIQYPTGQGKTALCFAIGAWRALTGQCVVVVNSSDELTFRDYKNASRAAASLKLTTYYQAQEDPPYIRDGSLYYMTTEKLIQLLTKPDLKEQLPRCLLIDEFDSFIFDNSNKYVGAATILQKFLSVFAFTGSDLQDYHRSYIECELKARNICMSSIGTSSLNVVCQETKVFSLIPEFKKSIVQLSIQQTTMAPLVIIADIHRERIKKSLIAQGLPVEDLADAPPAAIESSLSVFTTKQQGRYPVYLESDRQGRGIDFPSTSEIEQNGGIYVLIATLPRMYLQFKQFLGRTGRIGNKGQYAIMLYDKQAINFDGQVYLQKKLEELRNLEIISMASLHTENQIIKSSDIIEEESLHNQLDVISQNLMSQKSLSEAQASQDRQLISEINCPIKTPEQEEESKNDVVVEVSSDIEEKKIEITHTRELRKRDNKRDVKMEGRHQQKLRPRDSLRAGIDQGYFQGYSDPSIHSEMLQDSVRMDCYQEAIKKVCKGMVVIDVGAGTGVLSVWAAQAGATKVFAIEYSGIAQQAREGIALNKVQDQVVVVQERAEDITLPIEKADVVLSEWMGYFLIFENMLPSVIHVKKQYLREGGLIIPCRASIHLAAFRRTRRNHGINLSFFNKAMSCKAEIDICKDEELASDSSRILDLDLTIDELLDNTFESSFVLKMLSDGDITGLVGWFHVLLTDGVYLSTSPSSPATHWKQTLFYFDQPLPGKAGCSVEGFIRASQAKRNHRALDISIVISANEDRKEKKFFYTLE